MQLFVTLLLAKMNVDIVFLSIDIRISIVVSHCCIKSDKNQMFRQVTSIPNSTENVHIMPWYFVHDIECDKTNTDWAERDPNIINRIYKEHIRNRKRIEMKQSTCRINVLFCFVQSQSRCKSFCISFRS